MSQPQVLIGSANLNDRSQKGSGDSETAVVIEDSEMFESVMGGEKYMASKFAASFRRHLWRQHLGMVAPQECNQETAKTCPTAAMRPAPHVNPDPSRELSGQEAEWENLVADPLGEDVERIWKAQAQKNTEIADDIFQVVPTDKVRNWKQYHAFYVARGIRTGHVASKWFASEAAVETPQRPSTDVNTHYRFRQTTRRDQKSTQRVARLSRQHATAILSGRKGE